MRGSQTSSHMSSKAWRFSTESTGIFRDVSLGVWMSPWMNVWGSFVATTQSPFFALENPASIGAGFFPPSTIGDDGAQFKSRS